MYYKIHKPNAGFTLIELITVMVVIGIISTIGLSLAISYNKQQQLTASEYDVESILTSARSRALSEQVPSSGCTAGITGYRVVICAANSAVSLAYCPSNPQIDQKTYFMQAVCGGSVTVGPVRQLPQNIAFSGSSSTYYYFHVLTGAADIDKQITTLTYNNTTLTKIITVYKDGRVDIN